MDKMDRKIKFSHLGKYILFLGLIILLGLFLRLYHFPNNFYYTMDEEVMNLIQRRIILGKHYPLIGSVSPLGTYLGPIFYYLGAVILFFSSLNPLGQGTFAAILGTFNIVLIFKVAKDLFNKRVALFAATFYSTSFLMVIFDRRYWHLTLGPILSLLILWSLYKIKQGKIKFVYLLTAALILGWNTDYTNLILFLFVFISWIIFKLPLKRKEIVMALVLFLTSNLPLVAFDIRHDFLNTRTLIAYFTKYEESKKTLSDRETLGQTRNEQAILTGILPFITFSRAIYTASDLNISEQHTYCKAYILDRNKAQGFVLPFLVALLVASFIYLAIKKWKSKESFGYKIVLSFYLVFQLGVLFYAFVFKGDVFEHYLATLLPYFFIILGVVLAALFSRVKIIALVLLLLFAILNINLVLNAYNPLSFNNKMEATEFALEKVGNQDFSLDSIGSCYRHDGFYYPFLLLDKYPVKSYQDPNYSWLYDYQVADNHPQEIVVMVSKGTLEDQRFWDIYNKYQSLVRDRKVFGDLEVLILDNSKKEF